MGQQGFLIDTNIAIASLGKNLPPKGALFVNILSPAISVISQIELLQKLGSRKNRRQGLIIWIFVRALERDFH